jgi:hypothetical protein
MHVEELTVQADSWEALLQPAGSPGEAGDSAGPPAMRWVPEGALGQQGLSTGVRKVLQLAAAKR